MEINEKSLKELGFQGEMPDFFMVLPEGNAAELHIEQALFKTEWNIMFTKGNVNGVYGKDYNYIYVCEAKSIEQIKLLIQSLNLE